MPTAPSSPKARTWWAGCVVHQELPKGAPTAKIKINGWPFKAVLDSGSAISLVQPKILPPPYETKTVLPITCVHGDTREVPVRRVTISATPGSWPVEVGLVKDVPVTVLLGRDWPGFEALLSNATQPASPRGGRRGRRPTFSWPLTVGEMVSPLPLVLTSSMMFTSRSREGAHLAMPSGKTSD